MKTIVICSGGLDSVSLAHVVAQEGQLHSLLSFDYGRGTLKRFSLQHRQPNVWACLIK